MKTADIFNVQNNVVLAFDSEGKHYIMHLLIENGLIRLEEVDREKVIGERIIFLGKQEPYRGELTEVAQETTGEVSERPKKKRRSKKKK